MVMPTCELGKAPVGRSSPWISVMSDYILHADGRIIIHRTGHRDEIEDEIIGKEGGCHDETAFLKLLVPIPEIIHTHYEDDGVIHGIGYLEKLAQDGLCELFRKDERGLEAKDHLVPMGYDRIGYHHAKSNISIRIRRSSVALQGMKR